MNNVDTFLAQGNGMRIARIITMMQMQADGFEALLEGKPHRINPSVVVVDYNDVPLLAAHCAGESGMPYILARQRLVAGKLMFKGLTILVMGLHVIDAKLTATEITNDATSVRDAAPGGVARRDSGRARLHA